MSEENGSEGTEGSILSGMGPCRICLIILVCLHPEVTNLLIG